MTTIRFTSEVGASLNLELLEQSEAGYESGDVLAVDRSRTKALFCGGIDRNNDERRAWWRCR
jgi:uncharacterized protein YqfB (UPF0267 family)